MSTENRFTSTQNIILPILIGVFNLFLLLFPNEMLKASKDGIVLWAMNILPSLLPFLIGTNILVQLGITKLLGVFLERIMYPLFKVPGCGAFAFISGMISGYPVGAKITQNLLQNNQISKAQAQRLISFSNNSGPLFILGAIGTSMIGNKSIGYFILFIHCFSAILTGLLLRFFWFERDKKCRYDFYSMKISVCSESPKKNIGDLLSSSVRDSIDTVLQIGGFVVIFSIVAEILNLSCFTQFMWKSLSCFGFVKKLGYKNFSGILVGIVEMTNGAKILTIESCSNLTIAILTALVSFGGFCVHMQSFSFMSKPGLDLNKFAYVCSKFLQALISFCLAKIILPFCNFRQQNIKGSLYQINFLSEIISSINNLIFMLLIITFLSLAIFIFKKIVYRWR